MPNQNAHQMILERREALGLSDSEVAERSGLSIYEYGDLELRAEEAFRVVSIAQLRRICGVLRLDLAALLGLPDEQELPKSADSGLLTRNKLVEKRRVELGLSRAELADVIGFETEAVDLLEAEEHYLEDWPYELICALATALEIPPRHLLLA